MPTELKHAPPRPAATIILIRDATAGMEVLLMRRHDKADFADAYVFPGGMVDPHDHLVVQQGLCEGLSQTQANRILGVDDGGLAYFAAAIRECFEEGGVLLARDRSGRSVIFEGPQGTDDYARIRRRLHAGEIQLSGLCREKQIRLSADSLLYFSCWITPQIMARRYETRFFLARMPAHQHALHDGSELVDSLWIRPEDALSETMRQELRLHFPTLVHLENISGFADTAALLEHARHRGREETMPLTPVAKKTPEGMLVTIPGREYLIPKGH
jgi:8-oxo-dGTP pyrophosphatase MutT (NUDIX family)